MKQPFLWAGLLAIGPAGLAAQCLMARPGSPFDFAAGPQTIFATDFSQDPLGEFPAGLEFKQGAMEVAQWQGKRALKASAPSALVVPLTGPLPESFSIEVGVVNRNTRQVGASTVKIYGGRQFLSDFHTAATRAEYGPIAWGVTGGGASAGAQFTSDDADACVGQEVTVRLQVNPAQVKLYVDERRLANVPNASFLRGNGIVIALEGRDDAENAVYLTRILISGRGGKPPVAATGSVASTPVAVETRSTSTTAPVAETTTSSGATIAKASPTTPITSKAALDTGTTPASPTGVRVETLNYKGTMMVHWDSMPDAVGYTIVKWLPDGKYAGANPLNQPAYGPERKQGITIELEQGPVQLGVIADYGNGQFSAPSAPVSVVVPRWHGRYRISVLGFKVERETRDDPLETDGKRDEVYLRAAVAERGPDGELVGSLTQHQSYVHGDVNAEDWRLANSPNYRIKAGSASALGGLKTGDGYPSATPWQRTTADNFARSFPLLLWEGELWQGQNTVQVALHLWETDQRPGQNLPSYDSFSPEATALDRVAPATKRLEPTVAGQVMIAVTAGVVLAPTVGPLLLLSAPALVPTTAVILAAQSSTVNLRLPTMPKVATPLDSFPPVMIHNALVLGTDDAMAAAITAVSDGVVAFVTDIEQQLQLALNIKDRPLGIRSSGLGRMNAVPAIFTLNIENAEAEALTGNGPANLGPGIYAYRFEDLLTEEGGNGIYTVYLQVERIR